MKKQENVWPALTGGSWWTFFSDWSLDLGHLIRQGINQKVGGINIY